MCVSDPSELFFFALPSELDDVPLGPCQGFYSLRDPPSGSSSSSSGSEDVDDSTRRPRQKPRPSRGSTPAPAARGATPSFINPLTGRLDLNAARACINQVWGGGGGGGGGGQQRGGGGGNNYEIARRRRRLDVLINEDDEDADVEDDGAPPPRRPRRRRRRSGGDRQPVELVQEKTWKTVFEREEGVAVQYLVLGGFRHFCCGPTHQDDDDDDDDAPACQQPFLVASAAHAGAGQQPFGWSSRQRADLMMAFVESSRVTLHFHNHHEAGVHYSGGSHQVGCPRRTDLDETCHLPKVLSERMDSFRRGLADCFTRASDGRARFFYSVTTTCDLSHGTDRQPRVPSTLPQVAAALKKKKSTRGWHPTALEACLLERSDEFLYWDRTRQREVVTLDDRFHADLLAGRLTGFVTLKGGRETVAAADNAAGKFGFCVQRYAPTADQLSDATLEQVKRVEGLTARADVEAFANEQQPRTLTSGTFHTWETISTSYLRWLMKTRGFTGFRVRHLLLYKFSDYPRHFLEPLLQRRHDAKRAGNNVAAECLKLLGNGSYGYNGLESTNYQSVRLVTHERLLDMRRRGLAHLTLQSITLVGIVRVKLRTRRRQRQRGGGRGRRAADVAHAFFDDEAAADDDDDDDDDDEEGNAIALDDDDEMLSRRTEERERRAVLGIDDDDDDDDDGDERAAGESHLFAGLSDDAAVRQQDERVFACESHERLHLTALYAVEVSGKTRRLFNNLPKAVAVLSNSKRLFFSHLHVMLECLDPRLAELCYIDTDSCVWSLTYENIEDCLLPRKVAAWKAADVLADETSAVSCHGKMKLEGTYRAALFKTTKIYRLFGELTYTRCKGVNRRTAVRLDNDLFDPEWTGVAVVHKKSLRPTKTGEIVIAHESRRLAKPYNFKRHVTTGGIHTLPFSDRAVTQRAAARRAERRAVAQQEEDD